MANMTDYERERATFRLEVPDTFNFGYDVVDRWAEDPDKLALLWVDAQGRSERYTFAEVRRASDRFASVLEGLGIGKGDGVLVILPRLPQWYVVLVGLMKRGAIPMPGTVLLTPKDIEYRLNLAAAKAVVVDAATAPKVDAVRDRCPTLAHAIVVGGAAPGLA
ncbi:MAG: hypothetical protein KatS3mg131_3984 [Candidatus Tectimicrobiota bacterium]|nr:MAG: hypothetical protein KatS3mg131_3984 [Candidatus Tectomicrobia bacterium]